MHVIFVSRQCQVDDMKQFFFLSLVPVVVNALHVRGVKPSIATDEPCEKIELPSHVGLEDHPIGPMYAEAKKELDSLVAEMSKVGTGRTPSFPAGRKSVYDSAPDNGV